MAGHHPPPAGQRSRPAGRVRVGQPVEAVAAHAETVPPVSRNRVGGRGQWYPGMEGGVEAGDLGDAGCRGPYLGQRGQRRRLVQGGQYGERA